MADLNTTELAAQLGVSKPRISQYVAEGKLDGCFSGEGRARRFDLGKVAAALGRRLDLGQMSGNGRATRRAIRDIEADDEPLPRPREGSELLPRDPDRLELATLEIKEAAARRARRENERDEGAWVLAEEVQRQSARAMAEEIGRFEAVLRDAARGVADRFGIDYREVRKVLLDQWRDHRSERSPALEAAAGAAVLTDTEQAADV